MVRTNQGGSILGFVIVGSVMAILLIGGAYFVRHNLSSAVGEAPGVMDDSQPNPADDNEKADTEKDETNQPAEDEATKQEENEPKESEPTTNPDQPVHDDTADQNHDDQVSSEGTSPDNLPETGPADMVIAGLLLSSVVGAVAAYLRSRALSVSL